MCRILIVEDDLIDRELLKSSLRADASRTFEFAEESRGSAVLHRVHEFKPDCVLLDLNLPDMDGLEVLATLSEHASMPIVMITAFGNEQIAVKAMKNGATDYIVKNTVTPETLLHTVHNAIEKWKLRAELRRQQDRYRMLTEAIPQVVWIANHPEGEFEHISQRWSELTGLPVESAFGRGWLDAVRGDDRGRVAAAWQNARDEGTRFEVECRIGSSDRGYRSQLVSAIPQVVDESVIRWFGTFTDIEDRRRAEQALLQKQKLESTGLLAGGIAHDFNNLLVGILGGISYALEALPATHVTRPTLQNALLASERAAMLTRQMLAYAGKGNFLIERVDIAELVRSTCNLVAASIPKMVRLNLQTMRDTPLIEADSTQVQQIIMNLIINAAEAIGEEKSGIVTIRTGIEVLNRQDPADEIGPGVYAVLEVVDTGCGMTEEVQARMFEPFFTTKFTGRGLGLAAVMGIVRSAKGTIKVKSALGNGTTFTVLLPAKLSRAEAAQSLEPAKSISSSGTILVVDDEDIVRRTARTALERGGYTVRTANDGKEAIAQIRNSPGVFDLILLDLNMPDLSGEETLRQLQALNPALQVAVFSGYSEQEIAGHLGSQPVAGILPKPFTSRTLLDKVAGLLSIRPAHV